MTYILAAFVDFQAAKGRSVNIYDISEFRLAASCVPSSQWTRRQLVERGAGQIGAAPRCAGQRSLPPQQKGKGRFERRVIIPAGQTWPNRCIASEGHERGDRAFDGFRAIPRYLFVAGVRTLRTVSARD